MSRPVLHPAALHYVGPEVARDDSELRLLLAVHRHGLSSAGGWLDTDFDGLSQTEAVARTNLSQPTVSTLAKGLRERGLLLSDGKGLMLNPGAGISFGVDIGYRQVRAAVADLHGQLLWDEPLELPTKLGDDAWKTLAWLAGRLRTLESDARARGASDATIMGVGVSLAGPVDRETGRLQGVWDTGGDWRFNSVTAQLGDDLRWDAPFIADRDANASAAAEELWGVRSGTPDIIYCKWAEGGVSAALILDHQIFHGATGLVGEMAHRLVPVDGRELKCLPEWFAKASECEHCGRKGCLETVTSLEYLSKYVDDDRIDAEGLVDLAKAYDDETHLETSVEYKARHALEAAAWCLGRVLAPLIEFVNPKLVILGGKIGANAYPLVSSKLNEGLRAEGVTPALRVAKTAGASQALTGGTSVRGAIALALIEAAPRRLQLMASPGAVTSIDAAHARAS